MYSLAPMLGPVVGPVAGAWYVSAHLHHTGCLIMSVGLQSVRRGDGWFVCSFKTLLGPIMCYILYVSSFGQRAS